MANTLKGMTDEEIEAFIQKLDTLPVKKKTVYSNREVAAMHSERILSFMKEKGYSFQDVAEMMATDQNKITGSTLASYLRGDKKKSGVKKSRKVATPQMTPPTHKAAPDKEVESLEVPRSPETNTHSLRESFERLKSAKNVGV